MLFTTSSILASFLRKNGRMMRLYICTDPLEGVGAIHHTKKAHWGKKKQNFSQKIKTGIEFGTKHNNNNITFRYYDHLPKLLDPLLLPNRAWVIEEWTPLDPCNHFVVSGSMILVTELLSRVGWEVGPTWIGLIYTLHSTDARLDEGNFESRSAPQSHCCAPNHFCFVAVYIILLKEAHPSGTTVSIKGCTRSRTMLR